MHPYSNPNPNPNHNFFPKPNPNPTLWGIFYIKFVLLLESLLQAKGLSTTHDNAEVVRSCAVVVIACKPYQCKDVLPALPFGPQHLVLSVVAGLRCPMHESVSGIKQGI